MLAQLNAFAVGGENESAGLSRIEGEPGAPICKWGRGDEPVVNKQAGVHAGDAFCRKVQPDVTVRCDREIEPAAPCVAGVSDHFRLKMRALERKRIDK